MSRTRDMTAANWARTLTRLRRNAEELAAHDWEIREPENVETPPGRRVARADDRKL